MNNLVSPQCVDFVKSFEGFSSTPYKDMVGVMTLGYGMTGSEILGLSSVSQQQASDMLKNLLNAKYAQPIKDNLTTHGATLTQNQFDALVSMAYNVGVSAVLGSTLYGNVCAGVRDVGTITANFTAWDHAGGKVVPGLLRRRQAEAAMFFGRGNVVEGGDVTMNTDPDVNLLVWVRGSKVEDAIKQINALGYAAQLVPIPLSKINK